MSLVSEYDDRPGPLREALVRSHREWLGALARAATIAIQEGHFRDDLDVDLFAYEFMGIGMALQYQLKLVGDPKAAARASQAFAGLLERSRIASRPPPSLRSPIERPGESHDHRRIMSNKSTTDRLPPLPIPAWIRIGFQALAAVSPQAAATLALRLFFTPRAARGRRRQAETDASPRRPAFASPRDGMSSRATPGARDRRCCSSTAGAATRRR
jgi:hypothetical protein